jgi:hypothetical protein
VNVAESLTIGWAVMSVGEEVFVGVAVAEVDEEAWRVAPELKVTAPLEIGTGSGQIFLAKAFSPPPHKIRKAAIPRNCKNNLRLFLLT